MNKSIETKHVQAMEELFAQGKSYSEIAFSLFEQYNIMIHSDTVRYYVKRKKKKKISYKEKLKKDGIEKVLVISDLHVPFHRDDILEIIEKYKKEVSVIIFGGDIIDNFAISKFVEVKKGNLSEEMADTHKLLKQIQERTKGIRKYMFLGNHETRAGAYMARNINEFNNLHTDNILQEIVDGFKKVDHENGTTTYYEKLDDFIVINSWNMQYRDAIIAHPLTFSKVAGKTAQDALDYFIQDGKNFSAVLIGHTHKISSCIKYDKFAYEIGCLCKDQPYANKGKLNYTRQHNGYFIATFKNKKFNPNLSKQVYL